MAAIEVYGYIPIPSNITAAIDGDKIKFEGQYVGTRDVWGIATVRFTQTSTVPNGDDLVNSDAQVKADYTQYATYSIMLKLQVDENMKILNAISMSASGAPSLSIPANQTTLVNLIGNTGEDAKYTETVEGITDDIAKLPNELPTIPDDFCNIWDSYDNYLITNGKIESEEVQTIDGISPIQKYVWKGDYPLDKLLYVIQSNLDILVMNNMLKGDKYAELYSSMVPGAISEALALEKHRLDLIQRCREFVMNWRLQLYLGILNAKVQAINAIANFQSGQLDLLVKRIQAKLYLIQSNGFKSNNTNKLFQAQLSGANSTFTAGMTETVPPTQNNAELMSLYTQVKTDGVMM